MDYGIDPVLLADTFPTSTTSAGGSGETAAFPAHDFPVTGDAAEFSSNPMEMPLRYSGNASIEGQALMTEPNGSLVELEGAFGRLEMTYAQAVEGQTGRNPLDCMLVLP